MCITFAGINVANGRFPIVLALNRDENPQRQTDPLKEWVYEHAENGSSCHIVGGQDLESKGTWFGYSKEHQRFAVLTNRRSGYVTGRIRKELVRRRTEPDGKDQETSSASKEAWPPAPTVDNYKSRGLLVCDVLKDGYRFAENQKGSFYRPFNLLLGSSIDGLVHVSEDNLHENGSKLAGESIFVMTNADDMNPPWPKAIRGKELFEQVLNDICKDDTPETIADKLLNHVLLDAKPFELSEQTEDERAQGDDVAQLTGTIFIPKNEVWHTRSSTVLIVDANQVATIVEWSHPLCKDKKDTPIRTQITCQGDV